MHLTVTPGARSREVLRDTECELRIRVTGRAVEGKANRELVAFLARCLNVPPSRVSLVKGLGSRRKVVEVEGLTDDEALRRLGRHVAVRSE